jgi:hypothetical protein
MSALCPADAAQRIGEHRFTETPLNIRKPDGSPLAHAGITVERTAVQSITWWDFRHGASQRGPGQLHPEGCRHNPAIFPEKRFQILILSFNI